MAAAEGVSRPLWSLATTSDQWSQVHNCTTQPQCALHFNKKPSCC